MIFGWLRTAAPLIEMRWLLDRMWLAFLCAMYLAGGAVLALQMRQADDPIVRRQLTWLRNGALLGMLPFALIYAVPYTVGRAPEPRHESGGAVAAADSADLGVRDSALPADGRRHHFPGRLRLHAGDAVRCWRFSTA